MHACYICFVVLVTYVSLMLFSSHVWNSLYITLAKPRSKGYLANSSKPAVTLQQRLRVGGKVSTTPPHVHAHNIAVGKDRRVIASVAMVSCLVFVSPFLTWLVSLSRISHVYQQVPCRVIVYIFLPPLLVMIVFWWVQNCRLYGRCKAMFAFMTFCMSSLISSPYS